MNYKVAESPYRHLVLGTDTKVPLANGEWVTGINFDNAASTPPLLAVMEEIQKFSPLYSSIHRGTGFKSQYSSRLYEEARTAVLNFVNADPKHDTVIFVKNATEAINKLSYRLRSTTKKAVVLSTWMEHHSNDLPWREKFEVDYVQVDPRGRLSLEDLEYKLNKYKGKVRLVTVTGASNVSGYLNPIHKIAELAHRYQAEILVDAAQMIPHTPINMRPANPLQRLDYLAFSAHKMYAPFGIGALIAPSETFQPGAPEYSGGGTAQVVTHDWIIWNPTPLKDEAGTPNVMGVVALVAAIKTLSGLGMKKIDQYECRLAEYTYDKLKAMPGITLYSDYKPGEPHIGVIPFNVNGLHHERVGEILAQEAGIAVRTGCFCTQPYVQKLLGITLKQMEFYRRNPQAVRPGVIRISFGMYNKFSEVNTFLQTIEQIVKSPSLCTG